MIDPRPGTIEYFTSKGYACYVPTIRFGISPYATKGYTAYDARQDVEMAKAVVETMSLLCEVEEQDGRVRILFLSSSPPALPC